jgi:hypothetical protein
VGKETDRRWEHGEDLSLLDFRLLDYGTALGMVAADPTLIELGRARGLRALMRASGVSQHTVERILQGHPVRQRTLQRVVAALHDPTLSPPR